MINQNQIIYNPNPFGMQFSINEEENAAFLSGPIEWIREDRSTIAKIVVYSLTFFITVLLIATVVGIPLVLMGVWEYQRQEEDARIASIRQRIIQVQMQVQNALGGVDVFANIPVLDLRGRIGTRNLVNFLTPDMLTAPIMKGSDRYARDFIAMKIRDRSTGNEFVQTIQQLYSDESQWIATQGGVFQNQNIGQGEFAILQEINEGRNPHFELVR